MIPRTSTAHLQTIHTWHTGWNAVLKPKAYLHGLRSPSRHHRSTALVIFKGCIGLARGGSAAVGFVTCISYATAGNVIYHPLKSTMKEQWHINVINKCDVHTPISVSISHQIWLGSLKSSVVLPVPWWDGRPITEAFWGKEEKWLI